jgi:hypothetical protein
MRRAEAVGQYPRIRPVTCNVARTDETAHAITGGTVDQVIASHNDHCVEVQRAPLPGYTGQVIELVGVCTCGWRSGSHQIYLGASTDWAQQRAYQQIERARLAHVQSLPS